MSTDQRHLHVATLYQEEETGWVASTDLRKQIISLGITIQSYHNFIQEILGLAEQRKSATCCFANVHMLVEAARRPTYATEVNRATYVLPDGVPLLWALRLLYKTRQERITGLDVLPTLLQEAAKRQLSVFFYGGTPEMLQQCADFCRQHHPALSIAGMYSPPFRPLTYDEEQQVADRIRSSGAALVFVSLGCPKQESWMATMTGRIPAVLLGIGGALPVTIGAVPRAPRWMQHSGLEWLFRLSQEPRRLFRRYATTNLWFTGYLLRQLYQQQSRS